MGRKHDELFKHTFTDPLNAASVLRQLLPAKITARIDWSTLDIVPGSFIDPELRARHTDVLYRVQLDQTAVLLYLLFEHQSRSDPRMPFRSLEYCVRIWRHELTDSVHTLPAILPIVLYHGDQPWRAPTHLSQMFGLPSSDSVLRSLLPELQLQVWDLSHVSDAELLTGLTAAAAVTLGSLKYSTTPEALLAWFWRAAHLLRALEQAESGLQALEALFRYAFTANVKPERLSTLVRDALGPTAEETMMTVADELVEKGRVEGHAQGLAEGREEGREEGQKDALTQTLLRLLELRFSPLPVSVRAALGALDASEMQPLLDSLVAPEFAALELPAWLAHHGIEVETGKGV